MKVCEVKICGVTRVADVIAAVEAGADCVGFVCVETSRRFVPPGALAELASAVPEGSSVRRVGVFRNASAELILRAVVCGRLDVVQLHGDESAEFARELAGRVEVWKAVAARPGADLEQAASYPAARIVCDGSFAGSGALCDWNFARALAARNVPVMLAGGITPANARAAWEFVRCIGLDTAGGVESAPGIKDRNQLLALMKQLRQE